MVVTLGASWPFLDPIWSIGTKFFEFLTPATLCQVGVGGRWSSPLGPKVPNQDLKDTHFLCPFKIQKEDKKSNNGCIKLFQD